MLSLCRTNVGSVPLSRERVVRPRKANQRWLPQCARWVDWMARLVSCPPLCPLYCGKSRPCVIHACVCGISTSLRVYGNVYGLAALCCRVCPKCSHVPLSSANPRPRVGCASWRSQTWCVLLAPPRMSLAASRWLSVERAVRVVYAVVFAPPTHTRHTTLLIQSTLHHLCPRGVSSHSRSHHASSPSACGPLEYGACVSLVHAVGVWFGGSSPPPLSSVCPLLVGGRLTTLPPPSSTHSSITSCCDACVCPLVEGCWFGLALTTILSLSIPAWRRWL